MSNKYRIKEFADKLGRSVQTIRRWEVEGKLVAKRLPSGQRYFDDSDVRSILSGVARTKRCVIVYCRVNSASQRDDLALQVSAMQTYCLGAGVAVDEWVSEIGGGLNFKRKRFLEILNRMQRGEVSKLLIAHRDRLMRFGFDLFAHLAQETGCEIVVVNQETLSPQKEMVEDFMAIAHAFSVRFDAMRKYKKAIALDFPEYTFPAAKDTLQ